MKSAMCLLTMAFLVTSGFAVRAGDNAPSVTKRATERDAMSEQTMLALFDQWERVWHEGQFDLCRVAWAIITSAMMKVVTGR